ncbi:hypothetical protein Scep_017688 [Stephania cephalantha]|uniref:Uncharacterized protein n=1 Tax=Stephania cephalantha TaxID=152367 RepID=A0AAP0IQX3_9MAGN
MASRGGDQRAGRSRTSGALRLDGATPKLPRRARRNDDQRDAKELTSGGGSDDSGAVISVGQRRGGALPDQLIPDETQQQWTTGCFDDDLDCSRRISAVQQGEGSIAR